MKTIFRIAKLELSTLFYSPIAWFLSIIFLFQASLTFFNNLITPYLRLQEMGGAYLFYLKYLTSKTMARPVGLFAFATSKVYLYMPLLTMGLISRELASGTIKLLYSSPVKVKQIVLGKFFAMVAYSLLLIAILSLFWIVEIFIIKDVDCGQIASGTLGVFLLLCAYSAIGLFMSCLTSYQIVAAISTLVVFAILSYIGNLWQGVDFVRDLTYFLSISDRAKDLIDGLITTKDLLYFIVITAMFIMFAIIKLQSDRETKPAAVVAGRYLLVFVLTLTLGYISQYPRLIGYADVTATQLNTVTLNTQKVIAQLGDEPMEIVLYGNLLDGRYRNGSPEFRNDYQDFWARYTRFKPNIKLSYVYYWAAPLDGSAHLEEYYPGKTPKEVAQRFADSYHIDLKDLKTPEEINKIIDLRPELYRCVMQVKFKGKSTFLRYFNDQQSVPSEAEITAAFKRLTVPLPKIAFLQGEYERSINRLGSHDYGMISNNILYRYALINQGFDVESITLQDQEIPKDISALVIGDPRAAFSPVVLAKIQKYIADGGNLMLVGEGEKKDVLDPLLAPMGIQIMPGQLLQTSRNNPLNMVKPLLTSAAADFSAVLKEPFHEGAGVNMVGVSGLTYDAASPFKIAPLLRTDAKVTWNKKGTVVLDSAAVVYDSANGDDHRSIAPVLALTRNINGKEQRIIVAGDADFLTTAAMREEVTNFVFTTQLFRWFTYGQFPIDATKQAPLDTKLYLTRHGLTMLKIFFMGILPGLLLAFAAVFLIRRKRK